MNGVPTQLRAGSNALISCFTRSVFLHFLTATFATDDSIVLLRRSQHTGWKDYEAFIGLFGAQAVPETVQFIVATRASDCSPPGSQVIARS
jgi:hypothetical protein